MSQNSEYAYQFLIDRGYSPQAAAAAVGHFQQESGEELNTRAIHDEGTGFGIAGFRDEKPGKGRKTNLMRYAKANKMNPSSLDTQLEFFDYELKTSERRAGSALKNAKTVEEANIAMMGYERPQGYSSDNPRGGHGYRQRLNNAKNILASYTGQDVPTSAVADAGEWVEPDQSAIDMPDEEVAATTEAAAPESRLRSGIKNLLAGMGSNGEQAPFDYTPAGEGEPMPEYDVAQGAIPVDAYRDYVSFSRGGNVEKHINPHEFFRMVRG
jgi:hypothetical protein